ncbi:three prime repair exonuclease 2-like isoform X1 [Bombyx mandarina]|uniref:Three prime repair exonuclease 2-like isoform X1 n=1 Tax=Bombyx mandarina TaxID=7092 RepID=A0A6J2KK30_BOMMA|nr:three prime repair exonuclease 2-like isoform X1 [Bombyx mandarina]
MVRIETFVFVDLETTDIPRNDGNTTRITEISLVAVKRNHIVNTPFGETPRVQQKLTLCLYPRKFISTGATEVTKLSNELLEHEPPFNLEVFKIIDTFLSIFTEPACLIAYNGHSFDFPILKNQLEKLKVMFSRDVFCADCLYCFYDIDSIKSNLNMQETDCTDEIDFYKPSTSMKDINESTPKRQKIVLNQIQLKKKAVRKLFYENGEKPKNTYRLQDVYRRKLGRLPRGEAHRAENDCIMALEIATVYGKLFVDWIDKNSTLFSEVKPMTIGVKLGY